MTKQAGPALVAGIGWRTHTPASEVIGLIHACLAEAGYDATQLAIIASLDRKASDPVLHEVASAFGLAPRVFTPSELGAVSAPGSTRVAQAIGIAAVAEPIARLAGTLLVPTRKSAHATCAIGLLPPDANPLGFGRPVQSPAMAMTSATLVASGAGR